MCRKPLAEVRPSLEKKLQEAAGTDVYVWYNYAAGDEQTVRPRYGVQTRQPNLVALVVLHVTQLSSASQ